MLTYNRFYKNIVKIDFIAKYSAFIEPTIGDVNFEFRKKGPNN